MEMSGTRREALRPSSPSASSMRSSWARWAAMRPSKAVTSTSTRMRLISPLARYRSSVPRKTTTMPSASVMPSLASVCRSGVHELRQHFTLSVGTPPRARDAGAAPSSPGSTRLR